MPAPAQHRLLVIGGGIAGASVAYFASRCGWQVTLIDAGVSRASNVPSALLNPVRGQSGQVETRAIEGMRLGWALIGELTAQGFSVPHEQSGVLRPLASDDARSRFEQHLLADLRRRWLTPDQSPIALAPGWPHLLSVDEGGWVAGAELVAALTAASEAVVLATRARAWDEHSVTLEGGEVLDADAVVWCGGSVGASWSGGSGPDAGVPAGGHTHRGGSVLLLADAPAKVPISSGVYLAPTADRHGHRAGLLGATFEAPTDHYRGAGPPLKSLHWLLSRAAALSSDLSPTVTGIWSGSRLSGERVGRQPGGWWALAGLGSKGFLLGPLLAHELVQQVNTGRSVLK